MERPLYQSRLRPRWHNFARQFEVKDGRKVDLTNSGFGTVSVHHPETDLPADKRIELSLGLGLRMVFLNVIPFGPADNPPGEDYEQRAEKGGNKILEGNFQISESEVDSEQAEQLAPDYRPCHADQEVYPTA
jgi:hypothetical protein